MARILLLLLIAFAIYLLIRGFTRSRAKGESKPPPEEAANAEDMVQCTRCGVNLPKSEALFQAGKLVCLNNPQCRP